MQILHFQSMACSIDSVQGNETDCENILDLPVFSWLKWALKLVVWNFYSLPFKHAPITTKRASFKASITGLLNKDRPFY